jgi:putative transcriptional regulator
MNKKPSRLTKAILETARGMLDSDVIEEKDFEKITLRHLKKEKLPQIDYISGEEIKSIRRRAHLSQAAFASYLNLTVGYISQLERGIKEPSGAVLALLNVVRRKGIDIFLP